MNIAGNLKWPASDRSAVMPQFRDFSFREERRREIPFAQVRQHDDQELPAFSGRLGNA